MGGDSFGPRTYQLLNGLRKMNNAPIVRLSYKDRTPGEDSRLAPTSEQTFDEGYENGFEAGRAAAKAVFDKERETYQTNARSCVTALESAVRNVRAMEQEIQREIEKTVPEIVYALVEEILAREVKGSDDPGREALLRALSLDATTEDAIVRMNPDDIETLTDISDLEARRHIEIVEDPEVEKGGAIVSIGKATLDARLKTALERVRKTLIDEINGESA